MLKWAAGQRIPSSESSTCSDMNPSAACCLSSTFRLQSPGHLRKSNGVDAAYARTLTAADEKENRKKCRKSLPIEGITSISSGTKRPRDSIYMHLDSIPVALRDVSNHWAPYNCENVEGDLKVTKRRQARLKKRPCRISSHKCTPNPLITRHENKNDSIDRLDVVGVTQTTIKRPIKKKQPCSCHHPIMVANANHYTIQTSPPEEPDELFHKALPLKRIRSFSDDCDTHNCHHVPSICDIPECAKSPRQLSPLTRGLFWLKLNTVGQGSTLSDLDFASISSTTRNSSLDLTNRNSAVPSEIDLSNVSLAATATSSKPSVKRKCSPTSNTTYAIGEAPNSESKCRCVVFNDESIVLSKTSRTSLGAASSPDLDQPSTLKRQREIRRKRRQNYVPTTHTAYNKNLKSVLSLPHGILSPFEISDTTFNVLSRTLSTSGTKWNEESCTNFTILKKATSTPKPNCPFDLTEDVLLSPGARLLDSCIIQTTDCSNTLTVAATTKAINEEDVECFATPVRERTWNSHCKILPKIVPDSMEDDSELANTPICRSYHINDNQDRFSSIVSTTLATSSTTDRQYPRSRRCLSFTSTPVNAAKLTRTETGQLDVGIYYNNGLLTVHVIRAKNLHHIVGERPCNAYVKINLIPQGASKVIHRTCVRQNSFNPKFDNKFAIKITQSDIIKRVLISTWHRDREKRKSEYLGCMSFAVRNILKKEINGSYNLISNNSNKCSNQSQIQQLQEDLMASRISTIIDKRGQISETDKIYMGNHKLRTTTITKKDTIKVYQECLFLQHLELESSDTYNPGSETTKSCPGRTPYTTTHKLVKGSNDSSYGFTIAWTKPPRIEIVDVNSLADKAGLRSGDFVVFVNKTNVITRTEENILKIIQNCGNQMILEIYRKPMANGTVSSSSKFNNNTLPIRQRSITRRVCAKINHCESLSSENNLERGSTTAHLTATETSTNETSRNRLQLPQITFSSEVGSGVIV